jgi:hypothetical protein
MDSILAINLTSIIRATGVRGATIDENDYRHLWTNCYEVRVTVPGIDGERFVRVDPATGGVRPIDGFSVAAETRS